MGLFHVFSIAHMVRNCEEGSHKFNVNNKHTRWISWMCFKLTIKTVGNGVVQLSVNCPTNIHLFKVNNRNTIKRPKICSKLTIKTLEQCQWRRSGVFILNFEHFVFFWCFYCWLWTAKCLLRITGKRLKKINYSY